LKQAKAESGNLYTSRGMKNIDQLRTLDI